MKHTKRGNQYIRGDQVLEENQFVGGDQVLEGNYVLMLSEAIRMFRAISRFEIESEISNSKK